MFNLRNKSRNGRRRIRRRGKLAAAILLLLLVGAALVRYGWQDDGINRLTHFAPASPNSKFYAQDLTVGADEVHRGDVVLYSGDVTVESGGAIVGNLTVYSGNIDVEPGGAVQGNVTAVSGDAQVAGAIDGNLVVGSGDIHLGESAVIGGDVSVMSGDIDRQPGAVIHGNLVAGRLKLPELPKLLTFAEQKEAPVSVVTPTIGESATSTIVAPLRRPRGLLGALAALIWRLVGAALGTGLIVTIVGLFYYVRPGLVQSVQETLAQQNALSFIIGLVSNLVLTFLATILIVTFCLAPVGIAVAVSLVLLNLLGWAALALTVGNRLLGYANVTTEPLVNLLVGAVLMTSLLALGWALGDCLRPLAYIVGILISSMGSGAVVVTWLRLGTTPTPPSTAAALPPTAD
ncbi:MAG: polymer-forming cytoskeletal protein [Caldilineaceae bacterium]